MDDVIGYADVKSKLRRILAFTQPGFRERARRFGVKAPGGALLHGPPGNSKTRLVMAAASSHGLPVIALSSADVYSPYVGAWIISLPLCFAPTTLHNPYLQI